MGPPAAPVPGRRVSFGAAAVLAGFLLLAPPLYLLGPFALLDQIGIETMFSNRIALGAGLQPPRFRWIAFVNSFMYPLDNAALKQATPDRKVFFAGEPVLDPFTGQPLLYQGGEPVLDLYTKLPLKDPFGNQLLHKAGDPLLEVYYRDAGRLEAARALLQEACAIRDEPPAEAPLVLETVAG